MLQETDLTLQAASLGRHLEDHKGQDVSVLDLRGKNNWTDFFIITTVSSKTHMDGIDKHLREFCREHNIEIIGRSKSGKNMTDEWRIIDLGWVIVHLMTKQSREFYELERLWR